jgi:hypothetical protein
LALCSGQALLGSHSSMLQVWGLVWQLLIRMRLVSWPLSEKAMRAMATESLESLKPLAMESRQLDWERPSSGRS